MANKTYTFVIGTSDDFEGIADLIDYYDQEGIGGHLNYQAIEFEAPEGADEETVTMIGRGHAFSNDWSMDGTFSFLHEGNIPTATEEWFVRQGDIAEEELAPTGGYKAASEQQSVDLFDNGEYHPNDPRNW